jgi:hypothetical protein
MEAVVANVEPLGEEEIEAAGVEAEMGQWGAPEEWSVVYHSLVVVEKVGPSIQRSAADGLRFSSLDCCTCACVALACLATVGGAEHTRLKHAGPRREGGAVCSRWAEGVLGEHSAAAAASALVGPCALRFARNALVTARAHQPDCSESGVAAAEG